MTFHAELAQPASRHGAHAKPSPSRPAAAARSAPDREPLYDALHACPTRRLLGWRMVAVPSEARDGDATEVLPTKGW
ncbi:hypothetical protein [Bosea sp. (in: a-proteobacteria)]|uniref:hypothetical protein n=1 Tax=Bosea sp. (in: a-proteobacteria) TaxID=1871050 RepID=UPI0027339803|nr:hypothetical protein [Bosea sp. (in: a-proteobacteria)]MDP3254943.1 hypothetical protein [Bosea sp. (in: a-proteobacteria)]